MDNEKRHNDNPIPENLSDWLSQDQLDALVQIENFGLSISIALEYV